MGHARNRGRYTVTLWLALCPCALALNPALDVSQYAHTSWKYRDGFTKGIVYDVAQTPDGFLWLATEFGLVRFDGDKPVPWEPPPDPSKKAQALPSNNVRKLFVDREGTLWISTLNGLASWKDGTLTQYPEFNGFGAGRAIQDHEGSIWAAARATSVGKLCEIRNSIAKCYGENLLGPNPFALHEDRKGYLWVGGTSGVWRWKPGPPEFHLLSKGRLFIQDIAEDQDGALLITSKGGLQRLVDGKMQMTYPFPAALREFDSKMFRDRDGGLWSGTQGGGIVHFHQGRTDVFAESDGLTGDYVTCLFEDREGNVWAATINGLDRFRELPIVTYTSRQGLARAPTDAVLAARDGSVWFDTPDGLNRLNESEVTLYSNRSAAPANMHVIRASGLPDHRGALFEDPTGRLWISSLSGVGYLENDHYIPTAVPAGGIIFALTQDNRGDLWVANQDLGLVHLSGLNDVQKIHWETFGRQGVGTTLAINLSLDGVWIGFENGGLAWFRDGRVQASYSSADGLAKGRVNSLRFDSAGTLWIATDGGLSLLRNGRLTTITKEDGLPCDAIHWTMPDDLESVWLMTPCGLVRARRADLESWSPGRTIQSKVFDSSDGLSLRATAARLHPQVGKSPDGRLWFWNVEAIGMVDPQRISFNKLPPPVQIGQVTADRKTYTAASERLRLPPLSRDLQIEYTALSLVASHKNRFRYKLEGYDRDWQDVGTRRQAFYTNLGPRDYRFRVMASNNDGVWNEAGAFLDFSIAPKYYQTTWFWASVGAAFIALLAALYQLRLRYLKHQFDMRLEARIGERTRLARDLHDTLLQSFQGVLLKFSTVQYMIHSRPDEAEATLERTIDQARAAISEGRDAVQGLRSSTLLGNDLARTISTFGESLVADQKGPNCPEFWVQVEGKSRDLLPLVRDEIYRIAVEALRNAFRHAQAKRIEVEIRYDPRQFRLCIADNGKGIDEAVLNAGGREGHHGLPGLRERAGLAGGKLSVWSRLDSGTEIELTIPASIAYTKPSPTSPSITAGNEKG